MKWAARRARQGAQFALFWVPSQCRLTLCKRGGLAGWLPERSPQRTQRSTEKTGDQFSVFLCDEGVLLRTCVYAGNAGLTLMSFYGSDGFDLRDGIFHYRRMARSPRNPYPLAHA